MHSDGEVLALDNAGTDSGLIGIAVNWDHLHIDHLSRVVPRLALYRLAVNHDELSEAGEAIFESVRDRSAVRRETVVVTWDGCAAVAWREPSTNI